MPYRTAKIYKAAVCVILCAALLCGLWAAGPSYADPPARGPWDRWYADSAKLALGRSGAVRVKGAASRAMLAVIAARVAGADVSPCTDLPFDDVPAGRWYTTSVSWAAGAGIVRGTGGNSFSPDAGLTEDAVYYALSGFYALCGGGGDLLWRDSVYADLAGFADWAKDISDYLAYAAGGSSGGSGAAGRIAGFFDTYEPGAGQAGGTLSLKLDRAVARIEAGETVSLAATTAPEEDAAGVVWTVDDPSVALVGSDGTAVGVSEGYATVTATSKDGRCAASCVLRVTPAPVRDPDPEGRRIDPDKPMIAVTYDDGPSKYTDTILDILEQYGAVATFFEQGKNLAYWPDAVNRALAMGCEVGNHSWDHPKFKNISEAQIADQLERTNLKFVEITGKAPTLVRPPYGGRNETVDAVCKRYGLAEIIWSIDTLDWQVKDAAKICKTIREEAYDGAVILVHSTHDFTVEASRTFIPELIAAGYQLVTVSELAEARGITLEPGHKYGGFARKD